MVVICYRSQCLQPPVLDPEESLCLCNPEVKQGKEDRAGRKLKGLEEERVSWSPGEEAERLMRRPEPPKFHFVAAGEELNNNHLK